MKVGIDVGGTFTDFLVTDDDGSIGVAKVLSTPHGAYAAAPDRLKAYVVLVKALTAQHRRLSL